MYSYCFAKGLLMVLELFHRIFKLKKFKRSQNIISESLLTSKFLTICCWLENIIWNNVVFTTIVLISFYFKVFENVKLKCSSLICFHSELNSIAYFPLLFRRDLFRIGVFRHCGCEQDMKTLSERFCLSFPYSFEQYSHACKSWHHQNLQAGAVFVLASYCSWLPRLPEGSWPGWGDKSRLLVLLKTTWKSANRIS